MEELISAVTSLELGQFMHATLAMSLLVCLQEHAKTMDSGLEKHQLVKVRLCIIMIFRPNFMRLPPKLNVVRCPILPTIQNGRVNQRGNKPGDTATYVCNSGYELIGQSIRTCQTGGEWSGEAPTCERLGICMHINFPQSLIII